MPRRASRRKNVNCTECGRELPPLNKSGLCRTPCYYRIATRRRYAKKLGLTLEQYMALPRKGRKTGRPISGGVGDNAWRRSFEKTSMIQPYRPEVYQDPDPPEPPKDDPPLKIIRMPAYSARKRPDGILMAARCPCRWSGTLYAPMLAGMPRMDRAKCPGCGEKTLTRT